MKTTDLIDMLASGDVAIEANVAQRRFAAALAWGLAGTLLMMMVLLGVRKDLWQVAQLPMFWAKLSIPALAACAALQLARQQSIPGMRSNHAPSWLALLVVVLVVAVGAAVVGLLSVPAATRSGLVFVGTWKTCTVMIALLSLPLLAGSLWAIKGLAPTRPRIAGGCAGLLAGAGAAAVYALHCPEMSAVFLGIWYVLGIAVPTAAGAVLGARILRW